MSYHYGTHYSDLTLHDVVVGTPVVVAILASVTVLFIISHLLVTGRLPNWRQFMLSGGDFILMFCGKKGAKLRSEYRANHTAAEGTSWVVTACLIGLLGMAWVLYVATDPDGYRPPIVYYIIGGAWVAFALIMAYSIWSYKRLTTETKA